jgi:membrane associated rhomboid family serine protease
MRERAARGLGSATAWVEELPLATKWLAVALCLLHVVAVGSALDLSALCLSVEPLLKRVQLYRLLAILLHHGLLHLVVNVGALVSIGRSLETRLGTGRFAATTAAVAILSLLLQVEMEAILWLSGRGSDCSVGFSGVLFGLYVLELANRSHERFFGFLMVPSALAPWVALAVMHVFMRASFFGHLSGICAGYIVPFLKLPPSLLAWLDSLLAPCGSYAVAPAEQDAPVDSLPFWSFLAPVTSAVSSSVAAVSPATPEAENLGENLRALLEMGFERREALKALQESNGNLEEAVFILSLANEDTV